MKQIILHVGFPRCGSTFLQNELFPRLDDVDLIAGKSNIISEYVEFIRSADPINIDLEEIRSKINNELDKLTQSTVIISNEGLVGDVTNNFSNHTSVTASLKAIFPEAKILMTFRRQDNIIKSIYSLYISKGGTDSIHRHLYFSGGEFNNYGKFYSDRDSILMPLASLNVYSFNYRSYYRSYLSSFGEGNVKAVPLELLKEDQGAFIKGICDFIGCENIEVPKLQRVNLGLPPSAFRRARFLNHFIKDRTNFFGFLPLKKTKPASLFGKIIQRLLPVRFHSLRGYYQSRAKNPQVKVLNESERDMIMDMYASSNKKFEEDLRIDLKMHEYY